jgi:aspartyl-tRNA(Asn)/glutamyl-tRNA(Gln) amidotransferase subunit A
MNGELWKQPLEKLAPAIRAGKISPVAITEACLDRIEKVDGKLQSFIHVSRHTLDTARKAEREIKAGKWRGALHGIPVGVKDNYLTHDMPTTAGSTAPNLSFPLRDSAAAARLRAAGAVLIGKTRTHEFAWGNVTPPVCNPWDLTRVPSGSSGGSGAAVAAGLCVAALGSDTGGSIDRKSVV